MAKRFLVDLTARGSWGDKSVAIQFLQDLLDRGYEVYLHTGNWNNDGKGLKFDSSKGEYVGVVDQRSYLYDAGVHPVDFFENLICYTFPIRYNEPIVGVYDTNHWRYCFSHLWTRHLVPKQKTYLLNPDLFTPSYKAVEKELRSKKNLIVYATWDDSGKFEKKPDRRRGISIHPEEFEQLRNFVEGIDRFCIENPDHRIVLVSKKAEDWSKILKSEFLDLRNFEEKGLGFSQLIHVLQTNALVTVGNTSSMGVWLCQIPGVKHFVFGFNDSSEITNRSWYHREVCRYAKEKFGLKVSLRQRWHRRLVRHFLFRVHSNRVYGAIYFRLNRILRLFGQKQIGTAN